MRPLYDIINDPLMAGSPAWNVYRCGSPPRPTLSNPSQPKPMRPLYDIANDILVATDRKRLHANPYLVAMLELDAITDRYGFDDARAIVLYALSNLTGFRGDAARVLKAELKEHLK